MNSRTRRLIAGGAGILAVGASALVLSSGVLAPETLMGSTSGAKLAVNRSPLAPIPDAPPESAPPLYWGAWIGAQFTGDKAPWDMTAVTEFEGIVDKGLSLIGFSSPFADCHSTPCTFYEFPTTPMESTRRYGAIPFFSWGVEAEVPESVRLDQPDFQLSDVLAGKYDGYIRKFATDARAWGYPFFLRFNWEMNGNWFVWAEQENGNRPGEFVKAWRYVHDIFTEVGATNATWVWCPNVDPGQALQEMSLLYPGDSYVDWTCLDGYNWGPNNPAVENKPWLSFTEIFESSYQKVVKRIAPTKPMVLGEFASSDFGGNKAAWIRDALIRIPTRYPRIRAVLWFNVHDRGTRWPIEISPATTEAFRRTIDSDVYLDNSFGDLVVSPIEPPVEAEL